MKLTLNNKHKSISSLIKIKVLKGSLERLPTRDNLSLFLDRNDEKRMRSTEESYNCNFDYLDPSFMTDWYESDGYDCIEITNVSFDEINDLTKNRILFRSGLSDNTDTIFHVYYLSQRKMGYSQITNGSSNTGWYVFRNFTNWDQLTDEIDLSEEFVTRSRSLREYGGFFKFNIDYKPEKDFIEHQKEKISSLRSLSENEITDLCELSFGDSVSRWIKNEENYREIFESESFKFFVNVEDYDEKMLSESITEVQVINLNEKTDQSSLSKSVITKMENELVSSTYV
jgi:hypothetical protein